MTSAGVSAAVSRWGVRSAQGGGTALVFLLSSGPCAASGPGAAGAVIKMAIFFLVLFHDFMIF
jgi:hypothetical protein